MSERFVGFYTTPAFWAIDKVPLEDSKDLENFDDLMQEVAFSHDEGIYKLMVCRDGRTMLQIPELEVNSPFNENPDAAKMVSWWNEYLEFLNCLYLLLNSAILEVQKLEFLELVELTRRDAFRIEMENRHFVSQNIATGSAALMYQMGRFRSTYGLPPHYDPQLSMRTIVPEEVFSVLVDKASKVFRQPGLVSRLSTIAKSVSQYKMGNYSLSLVLAWFVIELEIAHKWRDFLCSLNREHEDKRRRINSKRMDNLTKGRDYTVSVISNFLELTDILPFDVFKRVDKVRSYRNKVVHQDPGFMCTARHCSEAIELALYILLDDKPVSVKVSYSYVIHGP